MTKNTLREKVEKVLSEGDFGYEENWDRPSVDKILSLLKKEILKGWPEEIDLADTFGWNKCLKELRAYIERIMK